MKTITQKRTGCYTACSVFASWNFLIAHAALAILIVAITIPGKKAVASPISFCVSIAIIEAVFLANVFLKREKSASHCDIATIVWAFLFLWELCTTDLNLMHPVLFPAPENVFVCFPTQWAVMLDNFVSSMSLLFVGFAPALVLGVVLGLLIGWVPRLRNTFYPIAHVLAPIPAVVFSPYLVAVLPSFRLASATVIFLGIFWPTLLGMIVRVGSIDRRIINSAKMMGLSNVKMVGKILLPYVYPSVVNSMKVQLPLSLTMLTFAEMMGATSGMGYYIINYTNYAHYTNVVAGIMLVGIAVTLLSFLIDLLEKKTVKWR